MCRNGWQRHIVPEATQVLEALKSARAATTGGKGGKGATGATIPVSIDIPWLIETWEENFREYMEFI